MDNFKQKTIEVIEKISNAYLIYLDFVNDDGDGDVIIRDPETISSRVPTVKGSRMSLHKNCQQFVCGYLGHVNALTINLKDNRITTDFGFEFTEKFYLELKSFYNDNIGRILKTQREEKIVELDKEKESLLEQIKEIDKMKL